MIIKRIQNIKNGEFRNKAILAIDYGNSKLGIAASDRSQTVASPKIVHRRKGIEGDISFISQMLISYDTDLVVIGLPLAMDGTHSNSTQQVKSFANLLNNKFKVNIFFWDERYSTKAAIKALGEDAISGKDTDQLDDKLAAALFLQSCLDYIKS
jgi:putative Holliday junction resolvase